MLLSAKFLTKKSGAHISITLRSEAMGLQRLICFKYYVGLKWKSKPTLGLHPAKIADYIKKRFK